MILLKCKLFIIGGLLIIVLLYCIYLFYPIKYTISENDIKNNEYYICKFVDFPGAEYEIRKSMPTTAFEHLNTDKYLNLYWQTSVNNIFVLYGKCINNVSDNGYMEEGSCYFELEDFDIIYPFKRNGILSNIIPSNYICRYDLSDKNKGFLIKKG